MYERVSVKVNMNSYYIARARKGPTRGTAGYGQLRRMVTPPAPVSITTDPFPSPTAPRK